MTAARSLARDGRIAPTAIAAIFLLSLIYYWNGLGPGDAERYLEAALRWREGPWLGDTHWALRHLFVLPIVACFAAFGVSETAALLPNVAYAALTVFITWHFGRRSLGDRAAAIAAVLVAASAFFVARPLELDVYGAEAFFAALSMWLFITAQEERARATRLFLAGLVAGVASTVREPSVYLLAVFGLLIVLQRKDVLRSLVFVAAGFAAVIAVELVVYAVAAGDPLYRYKIDLGHRDISVNAAMTPEQAALPARALRGLRHLATSPATTPMLFFTAIGLLYLRSIGALSPNAAGRSLRSFGAVAVLSAVIAPLVFNLSSTRYYPLLTYWSFLVVGFAISWLWAKERPRAALAAVLGVVAVNVAAADFPRDGGYAEAGRLAQVAVPSTEPVYADPLTAYRARYQLRLGGMSADAAAAKAVNGRYATTGVLFLKVARVQPPAQFWCVLETFDAPPDRWTHRLIRDAGLASVFGRRMVEITAAPTPVQLVRLLDKPETTDPVTGRPCLDDAVR